MTRAADCPSKVAPPPVFRSIGNFPRQNGHFCAGVCGWRSIKQSFASLKHTYTHRPLGDRPELMVNMLGHRPCQLDAKSNISFPLQSVRESIFNHNKRVNLLFVFVCGCVCAWLVSCLFVWEYNTLSTWYYSQCGGSNLCCWTIFSADSFEQFLLWTLCCWTDGV